MILHSAALAGYIGWWMVMNDTLDVTAHNGCVCFAAGPGLHSDGFYSLIMIRHTRCYIYLHSDNCTLFTTTTWGHSSHHQLFSFLQNNIELFWAGKCLLWSQEECNVLTSEPREYDPWLETWQLVSWISFQVTDLTILKLFRNCICWHFYIV